MMCDDQTACGLNDNRLNGLGQMRAQLRHAGRWLAAWLMLPLLVMGLLLADCLLRPGRQVDEAGRWMRALDLSAPAFQPSGTALRHPEFGSLAVDTRLGPFLPLTGAPVLPMTPNKAHEN